MVMIMFIESILLLSLLNPLLIREGNAYLDMGSFPAYAQLQQRKDSTINKEAIKTYELGEVMVSDHLEQIIKEESSNISFVRKDYLRKNRGNSLMKTMERLPGISTVGIGSGTSKPLIRGLGFNQVLVLTNGIKHEGQQWGADHGLELDQYNVDQVQIIKGPASISYGSDAIAGVIDIKDKPVPDRGSQGGSLILNAKSNTAWLGASANIYGRREKWFYDMRFSYASYGDFKVPADTVYVYDFGVALDQGKVRNTAGKEFDWSVKLGYLEGPLKNTLTAGRVYMKSGFFANAHGLEPRNVNEELHDSANRDILLPHQEVGHFKLVDQFSYRFEKHLIEADFGFQLNERKEWSQYVNHGFMPPNYPDELSYPSTLERSFDKKVFSMQPRDEWFLNKHQLQFGLSGEWQINEIGGWGFLIPAFRKGGFGLYALDKFKINEEWQVQGALRYDYSRIAIEAYQDWFPSTEEQEEQPSDYLYRSQASTRTFNSQVWALGFNYVPGKFSFKGNIGTGFRVPIAKELGANGVNYHYYRYERGNADLAPEKSYQLDLGVTFKEDRWQIDFSPFLNYFSNYIYLSPSAEYDYLYGAGNQVFNYTQSEVVRFGGELAVIHQINKDLDVELLGEYVYSEQLSGDKKGYTLPFSPPPSILLNTTYKPSWSLGMENPYLAIDYRLTARQQQIVPPEKMTPGYQLVDLRFGAELNLFDSPLQFDFQVRNVSNTRYLNHTSFYRLIDLPEQGRSFNISFQLDI